MKLEFHPDAVNNFNSKADDLLLFLSPRKEELPKVPIPTDLYVDHVIKAEEVIGEITTGEVDLTGEEVAKYFSYKSQEIGLIDEAYKKYHKLCEAIQRTLILSKAVSFELVKEETFEWMKSRYKGETDLSLIEFIKPRLESTIKEVEIWVPIYSLTIQSSFTLGRVIFQPITKALLDDWYSKVIDGRPEEEVKRLTEYFQNERKDIQGFAAGTIKLVAEPKRAGQIALVEVEQALNLLRFFELANLHPMLVSHSTILGKENQQTTKYYVVENNVLTGSTAAVLDKGYRPKFIDDGVIAGMKNNGLDLLNTILLSENKSPFQTEILDTLQIYSRVGLATNISDKLVYLLVTIESLLLKNDSEPIQQNIGERMAFVLARDSSERKKIVKNVKDIYELRSKFVHHGNDVESEHVDTLQQFMFNVWVFLEVMIKNMNRYQTREEMIGAIETIKYT